jgi:hypothetical protein
VKMALAVCFAKKVVRKTRAKRPVFCTPKAVSYPVALNSGLLLDWKKGVESDRLARGTGPDACNHLKSHRFQD